jgi:uncharacterized repeat protein (TIGR01451 family)
LVARPSRWLIAAALWLSAAGVAGLAQAQDGSGVCRVDAAGTSSGDGSGWTQAMDLRSALDRAGCIEVWIREGVYKPTSGIDRDASFVIRSGVAVYGGFGGTETGRDERNPAAHRSVLSGDIDGNDAVDASGTTVRAADIVGDNSYHVVRLDGSRAVDTVLDGFTVTGGFANGTDSAEAGGGGGLLCSGNGAGQDCSPTLRNLALRGNSGMSGGGMLCVGQNQGACHARLDSVAFVGNAAVMGGGLMNAAAEGGSSSPSLDNVTFFGNRAEQGGGGIGNLAFNGGTSSAILRNVTFGGNDAAAGGALASQTSSGISDVTLVNTILWGDAPDEMILAGATATLSHGIAQGGCPAGASCTDLRTGDPRLGALQEGITPTLPLGTNSAAIDAADCDDAPALDQRGVVRPQGAGCDIGAVEARQARLAVAVSGGGKVNVLAVPLPLGAPIADCRQGHGACGAWYRVEPDAPTITLTLRADAGSVVQSASGCGGALADNRLTFATAALAGDCTVAVAFAPAPHRIGGTVTGLAGSGLVLALDDHETLPIDADGRFAFETTLVRGDAYTVTVRTQPSQPAQDCAVINGSGTVGDSDVANVVVHCGAAATYTVGGTLAGLASSASVTLSINGGNKLTLAANGAYAFASRFVPGDGYLVAVTAQPAGQHCTLSRAEGTVGSADVSDVDVNCTAGGANLLLSVSDDGGYARYGHVRTYVVTLNNAGNDVAENVSVGANLDAAFDDANVQWTCVNGAPGASCTAQGAGGFADHATLPPGARLVWIVRAPIRGDSDAAQATFLAHAEGAADASDTDTLVIFRDGVDVPYVE